MTQHDIEGQGSFHSLISFTSCHVINTIQTTCSLLHFYNVNCLLEMILGCGGIGIVSRSKANAMEPLVLQEKFSGNEPDPVEMSL